ncbi:ComF family protein [Aurantibacter sp.]|uniref:ComF family protein n=1 Tax=Aurantibacter sp. TaxID=2807103 RepID=UPI00326314D3
MCAKLSNIVNDISSILVPRVCFGCNTHLLGGEHLICTSCRNDLPLTDYTFNVENTVDRIFYGRINVKKANSFLFFTENGIVQQLLHHLKYKNQEIVGDFIGEWFGNTIKTNGFIDAIDYVVPVPLHRKKLQRRGYNQVTRFAKHLATNLNAEFRDDILLKTSNSKTQTKKGRLGRWFENKSLYTLSNSMDLANKNVLLVDDIITTGATIELCAKALQKSKNINIYVASMAVVPLRA